MSAISASTKAPGEFGNLAIRHCELATRSRARVRLPHPPIRPATATHAGSPRRSPTQNPDSATETIRLHPPDGAPPAAQLRLLADLGAPDTVQTEIAATAARRHIQYRTTSVPGAAAEFGSRPPAKDRPPRSS